MQNLESRGRLWCLCMSKWVTHCLAMSLKLSAQIHKLRGVRALRQSLWWESNRVEQAWSEWGQRAAARAQTQLGMVHISPRREGRMPIIQLCPVHTEPDQWISLEKNCIKSQQTWRKTSFKVKLTHPGVVTSLLNGQTWHKSPDIKVWTFLFRMS